MNQIYQIDPSHSTASFSVKHMMIAKVHGAFEKMSGKLIYSASDLSQTSVEVAIEASSITTREAQRDAHLKSADFFEVEKYPLINFKSSRVEGKPGDLKVIGDLTINCVTQKVTLEVEGPSDEVKDPWGNFRIAASGTTKIKRKDFGLTWNTALEAGGLLVGDDVTITLEVQFVKQA